MRTPRKIYSGPGRDQAARTALLMAGFSPALLFRRSPENNQYQTAKMKSHGLFSDVQTEVGQIIVANVNHARIEELLSADRVALWKLIRKES
jgi:hypothetical protein